MTVLYVCEPCREDTPESCGYDDKNELRDINDYWVCRNCFDVMTAEDCGLEGEKPDWGDLQTPKEYQP